MSRKRRAKGKIIWQPKDATGTPQVSASAIAERAVLDFVVTVLFLLSAIRMYGDLICKSPGIHGKDADVSGKGSIILLIFSMVIILDVIGRLRRKYHFEVWLLTAAVYVAGLSIFAWRCRQKLEMGFCQLGNSMGKFVNNYYHVTLPLPRGHIMDIPTAIGFLFACMAVFFLLVADICACRLLIGIMPLLVLSAGLSVGYAPQIEGLAIGFAGLFLSGAGAWQTEGAFFHRNKKAAGAGTFVRLLPILAAVLLSLLIPVGVRLLFTEQAQKVTLVGGDVLAKQKELEQRIMDLFGPSEGSSGFGEVDNHMPRYRHKEVLQMEIEGGINGDQYLRGYFGTDYVDGKWMTDEDAFARACSQDGYDGRAMMDHASSLGYETELALKSTFVIVQSQSRCNVRYTDLSTDIVYMPYNLTRPGNYVGQTDGNGSFLPYSMPGDENYERAADTIMRKPKGIKETEWSMWPGKWTAALMDDVEYGIQTLSYEDLGDEYGSLTSIDEATAKVKQLYGQYKQNNWKNQYAQRVWYNKYVKETYLSTSEDISSARGLANEVRDTILDESAQEFADMVLNMYQEPYADGVKLVFHHNNGLCDVLTYTLPKDDVPSRFEWEYAVDRNKAWEDGNYCVDTRGDSALYNYDTYEGLLEIFGVQDDNQLRYRYAQAVADRLAAGYMYNTQLGALPAGEDAVEYFLGESYEGYCTHFATAGVMILRELGVPARYATGYIVKEDTFSQIGDGKSRLASVQDDNAHAWVEIYLEDIGWIPVEMTPSYNEAGAGGSSAAQGFGTGSQAQQDTDERENHAKESQTQEPDEKKPSTTQEDGNKDPGQRNGSGPDSSSKDAGWRRIAIGVAAVSAGVLAVAGIVAGIILFFVRRKKQRIRRLEREIRLKRNRHAVNRMNRWIYRKMRRKGHILAKFLSDPEYEKKLGEIFPEIPKEEWAQFMVIVKKAHFSANDIEDEEAALCYRIYKLLFAS